MNAIIYFSYTHIRYKFDFIFYAITNYINMAEILKFKLKYVCKNVVNVARSHAFVRTIQFHSFV